MEIQVCARAHVCMHVRACQCILGVVFICLLVWFLFSFLLFPVLAWIVCRHVWMCARVCMGIYTRVCARSYVYGCMCMRWSGSSKLVLCVFLWDRVSRWPGSTLILGSLSLPACPREHFSYTPSHSHSLLSSTRILNGHNCSIKNVKFVRWVGVGMGSHEQALSIEPSSQPLWFLKQGLLWDSSALTSWVLKRVGYVILKCSLPFIFEPVSHWTWSSLIQQGWPASVLRHLPVSVSLTLGLQARRHHAQHLLEFWALSSCLHGLPNELPPQAPGYGTSGEKSPYYLLEIATEWSNPGLERQTPNVFSHIWC